MSHMNSRNRKKYFRPLVERDGEYCRVCKRGPDEVELVIDHWDNNNANNALINLQILCRSDNARKNPRGKARQEILSPVSVCEVDRPRPMSAELAKNRKSEPAFRHWVYEEIRNDGPIALEDAVNTGSEVAQCSSETIRRYVKKMCSRKGPFELVRGEDGRALVALRPIPENIEKKLPKSLSPDSEQEKASTVLALEKGRGV